MTTVLGLGLCLVLAGTAHAEPHGSSDAPTPGAAAPDPDTRAQPSPPPAPSAMTEEDQRAIEELHHGTEVVEARARDLVAAHGTAAWDQALLQYRAAARIPYGDVQRRIVLPEGVTPYPFAVRVGLYWRCGSTVGAVVDHGVVVLVEDGQQAPHRTLLVDEAMAEARWMVCGTEVVDLHRD